MLYPEAHTFEPEADRLGVSTVARRAKGSMREYEKAVTANRMRDRPLPNGVVSGATWGQKRRTFIAQHLRQYEKHPTHRRYLALIMWAFKPPPP